MRDPTVGVLLLVFVRKCGLERPSVQVQFDDVSGSKCCLGQGSEEEFVDDPVACHTNWSRCLGRRMGSDDDSHSQICPRKWDIWTVEERTAGSRFRMAEHFIRWESQTGLYGRQIKQAIVFAAYDIAQTTAC
jgi:hypothetical protein